MEKTRVLFLCTGNSARSQMAEAFLRRYAGDYFEVHSAGLEPKEIHPYTLQVMEEAGCDMQGHTSKTAGSIPWKGPLRLPDHSIAARQTKSARFSRMGRQAALAI